MKKFWCPISNLYPQIIKNNFSPTLLSQDTDTDTNTDKYTFRCKPIGHRGNYFYTWDKRSKLGCEETGDGLRVPLQEEEWFLDIWEIAPDASILEYTFHGGNFKKSFYWTSIEF